jgi:hypothetical protein
MATLRKIFPGAQTVPKARRWPKRLLRAVIQTFVIVAVTLALDHVVLITVFAEWKRNWRDAATAYTQAYVRVPWHHDLAPNQDSQRPWGKALYRFRTDRYGFRTGDCAPGEADKSKPAVFAVGDSFTEALGVPYEESFVGLMACEAAREGKAVWNLGVMSFSPVIYHRKIKAAAEKLGLRPTEVYVFLDLSDIMDEALVYHEAGDGSVEMTTSYHWFDTGQFLLGNFATFRLLYDLWLRLPFGAAAPYEHERARWTLDADLMQQWGRRGLERAGENLDKIVALCREWQCRMTLVVYPWPDNVAAGDRNGIQVRHWQRWAASRGVRFVDGFGPFFQEPPEVALRKYFIQGDAHFTPQGHRLLFEELRRSNGPF